MKIEYLREFSVLAEQLNFTLAAESLYITQPALSNHIASLEKIAGFKLIERERGSSSHLTKTGRAFLAYANKIVSTYDEAMAECQRVENDAAGALVVQVPVDMHTGVRRLLDLLQSFSNEHPNIEVIRRSNSSYGLTSPIRADDVDVALTRSLYLGSYELVDPDEDLGYIPLSHEPVSAWIGADHPLASKKALSIADLETLTYPYMTPFHHATWKRVFNAVEKEFGIKIDSHPVLVSVREDFYLGTFKSSDCIFLSQSLKKDLMFDYRTDRAWKDIDPPIEFAHWMVYNKQADNPALDAFISFVAQETKSA